MYFERFRVGSFLPLLANGLVFAATSVAAVEIEWVIVGNPDNEPDLPEHCYTEGCGSVPYEYSISKYEITNAQYVEFLNAKAAVSSLQLYHLSMGGDFGGITRSENSGIYTYEAKLGYENRPVNWISFYNALRFANWMHNGQGDGDTESGAYTLLGGTARPANYTEIVRTPGPGIFVPTENEWYKAAYYDTSTALYSDYPAGTDTATVCAPPDDTPNTANCEVVGFALTDVGAYTSSPSSYGTFDQGGNLWEWTEDDVTAGHARAIRGGSWANTAIHLSVFVKLDGGPTSSGNAGMGFRLVNAVPEADAGLLGAASLAALAALRKRRSARGSRPFDS